jgi:hypothetical protein
MALSAGRHTHRSSLNYRTCLVTSRTMRTGMSCKKIIYRTSLSARRSLSYIKLDAVT